MAVNIRWHPLENAEAVAQTALQKILGEAQKAIIQRGMFKLVLAGGTTPKRIYQLLSEQQQEWSKWYLFIGDERCLDADDAQRNSLLIRQSWLDKIDFPMENFYPIRAEHGPDQAASEYAEIIAPLLPFDLTLLGLGEDGHTASLFPGHLHNENELVHGIYHSPKPPPERVSLSNKALAQSEQVYILVTGSNKKNAVQQWRQDAEKQGMKSPVARIRGINGVDVFIDQDASGD